MKLAITVQNHADYRRVEAIGEGVEGSAGNGTPPSFFKVYLIEPNAIVQGVLEAAIWTEYREWHNFQTNKLTGFALKGGAK